MFTQIWTVEVLPQNKNRPVLTSVILHCIRFSIQIFNKSSVFYKDNGILIGFQRIGRF